MGKALHLCDTGELRDKATGEYWESGIKGYRVQRDISRAETHTEK